MTEPYIRIFLHYASIEPKGKDQNQLLYRSHSSCQFAGVVIIEMLKNYLDLLTERYSKFSFQQDTEV